MSRISWRKIVLICSVDLVSTVFMQEEVLLSLTIAMAISWLLYSLRPSSANDYAFACFFLICTTSLLKIRWVFPML